MSVEVTCGKCGEKNHQYENVKISKRCNESLQWKMSILWTKTLSTSEFSLDVQKNN